VLKIEAIVRNSKIHEIQQELEKIDVPTFSSYEVKIAGIHKGHKGWRSISSDLLPKSKIEILCKDNDQKTIVDVILNTARTGEKGDGIVFVYNVDKLVKIKNGVAGEAALK